MFAIEVSESVRSKCRLLGYRIHSGHVGEGRPRACGFKSAAKGLPDLAGLRASKADKRLWDSRTRATGAASASQIWRASAPLGPTTASEADKGLWDSQGPPRLWGRQGPVGLCASAPVGVRPLGLAGQRPLGMWGEGRMYSIT